MCYGDPSATEVPPYCEAATTKLTFSTTSVLLLLNMPLSLYRGTIFRLQKNPRRVYRPKIAGILFVCNEPEGKYYTVPTSHYSPKESNIWDRWCHLVSVVINAVVILFDIINSLARNAITTMCMSSVTHPGHIRTPDLTLPNTQPILVISEPQI